MTGVRDHIIARGVFELLEGGLPPIPVHWAAVERDGDGPAVWIQTKVREAHGWPQQDASGFRRIEVALPPYVDSRKSMIFARILRGPDGTRLEEAAEVEIRRARPADAAWLSRFGLRTGLSSDVVGALVKARASGTDVRERLEAVSIPGRPPHALVYRIDRGAETETWVLNRARWYPERMARQWVSNPRILAAHRVGRSLPWLTGEDAPTNEPGYLIGSRMMVTEIRDWGIESAMNRMEGPERAYDTAYFLALACEPDDMLSPAMMGPTNAAALAKVGRDATIPEDDLSEPWYEDMWVNDSVDDDIDSSEGRSSEASDELPPFVLHDEDDVRDDEEGIAAYEALVANLEGLKDINQTLTAHELVDALDFYEDQVLTEDVED